MPVFLLNNKTLLNNEWVYGDIKEEIKISLESNENKDTKTPTPWDVMKAVLGGKFIALSVSLSQRDPK
jgi:hypothetical protein